ncbi:hypothetical protein CEXT_501341 [Caerostris extrusa]|uniref:Uncharacterized protein n=1 Tax=Caerostris extrusa TaxID=172846 RepID=A0AAV4VKD9_CAEEX|nr:hypothetical protein CEXT_501341 [Caerostris extrusa]
MIHDGNDRCPLICIISGQKLSRLDPHFKLSHAPLSNPTVAPSSRKLLLPDSRDHLFHMLLQTTFSSLSLLGKAEWFVQNQLQNIT